MKGHLSLCHSPFEYFLKKKLTCTRTGLRGEFSKVIDFIFTNANIFAHDEAPPIYEEYHEETTLPKYVDSLFVLRHSVVPQEWEDGAPASDHAPVMAELIVVDRT